VEVGTGYLINSYGNADITIAEVENVVNNSEIIDKSTYTARYTIRFDFFNHVGTTINSFPITGFVPKNVEIK
jgi:hypothetical protein